MSFARQGKRTPHDVPVSDLRVCMVHYSCYHIDSRIQRQARAIAERGGRVDAVCLSADEEIRVGEGVVRLHNIPMDKPRSGARAYLGSYAKFLWRAGVRVAHLDRRHRFHVIEADNMPNALVLAGLAPKMRGVPVVLDVHDTFPELFRTKFGDRGALWDRAVGLEERLSAAFADGLMTVTDEARERLRGRGVSTARSCVVMNSPDEGVFGEARAPVRWDDGQPLRLVYHGGTAERFGLGPLVEAMGALAATDPEIELEVYGSDDERVNVARHAAAVAPRNVCVAPAAIPFRDIPGKLEFAHVGVVPTLRDDFTELLLPVKLMEYVHMGLPVITSRLPVIERYFSDEEVHYFEPGDVASLIAAITEVQSDFQAARRRAQQASERLRGFEWVGQRENYLDFIRSVASRRGIAAPLAV